LQDLISDLTIEQVILLCCQNVSETLPQHRSSSKVHTSVEQIVKQSIRDVRWWLRLLDLLSHLLLIVRRLALGHASLVVCELLENGPKPFWFFEDEKSLVTASTADKQAEQGVWQEQMACRSI